VDEANWRPGIPRSQSSELTSDGLVLWRLSATGQSDLWCLVFEFPDAFYFVLEDDPHGIEPPRVTERHCDIDTLIDRAEGLKRSLLLCGWTDIEDEWAS